MRPNIAGLARRAGRGWPGLVAALGLFAWDWWRKNNKGSPDGKGYPNTLPGMRPWWYNPERASPTSVPFADFADIIGNAGQPPTFGEYGFSFPLAGADPTGRPREWSPDTWVYAATWSNAPSNTSGLPRTISVYQCIPDPLGTVANVTHIFSWRIDAGTALSPMSRLITPTNFAAQYFTSLPAPNVAQNFFPMISPVGAPAFPDAPPIYRPSPRPEPWTPEMPDVGPRPAPRPQPETFPNANPSNRPTNQPDTRPDVFPGVRPNLGPTAATGVGAVSVTPHSVAATASAGARPPGRHTKERKAGLPPWASFVWRAAGHVTEGVDAINAVYEAMPKSRKIAEYKKRGRQPNPAEKLGIIYSNIGELNMGLAAANIINENIEDKFYGKQGQALTAAGQNMFPDRPIGLGAGPAFGG